MEVTVFELVIVADEVAVTVTVLVLVTWYWLLFPCSPRLTSAAAHAMLA